MKSYLPIMLDVSNMNILLLGAGKASTEKLRTLAQLKKEVTVISPEFGKEFLDKPWLRLVQRKYRYGDLAGFNVVYSGINDRAEEENIYREARERKILVNFIDQV